MKLKNRIDRATEIAILNSANLFTVHWGKPELSDAGTVGFPALPETLAGLHVRYSHGRQFMGGNCHMQFCLCCETDSVESGYVSFKGKQFSAKKRGAPLNRITTQLNGDTELINALRRIDLEALIIEVTESRVEVVLTPYGGGLAYLVIPPVRCPVPFPPDQVESVVKILERLVHHLGTTKESEQ